MRCYNGLGVDRLNNARKRWNVKVVRDQSSKNKLISKIGWWLLKRHQAKYTI
jgi:hypothetical protein